MNRYPILNGLFVKRFEQPSSATCAFLAAGLEIFSQVLSLMPVARLIELTDRSSRFLTFAVSVISALVTVLIFVCTVAAIAMALRGVGRRQRSRAPISARLGQWAVFAYVAVNVTVFVLLVVTTSGGLGVWPSVGKQASQILVSKWGFQIVAAPLTLAFGCLGFASSGGDTPRQRWAIRALLAAAALGIVSAAGFLWGFPSWYHGPWLRAASVALRAGVWVAVGLWLRSPAPGDLYGRNLATIHFCPSFCGMFPALAFLIVMQPSAKCVEFSAQMAYAGDGQLDWGKAYAGDEKLRLEFQKGWTIRIVDLRRNTEYESINHAPASESHLGRRVFELLVGGPLREPASPCEQILSWLGVVRREHDNLSCKPGLAALVNDRHTERWDFTVSADGSTLKVTAWVDPVLNHCIRIQVIADGESMVVEELRNIKVERQPSALFEIPTAAKPVQ